MIPIRIGGYIDMDAWDLEAQGGRALKNAISEKPSWIGGQISETDTKFLSGLVQWLRPKNAVEIGVASGWSSSMLLKSMSQYSNEFKLTGVDLSPDYYLDPSIRTGAAVDALVPELQPNYCLVTGQFAYQAMPQIGSVDFAFIDAHHMHPWASLDLISLLPFMDAGSWVAMHDINLCRYERHMHRNRGPFYLYYMWPHQKINSTQQPTMIGAVCLVDEPKSYLPIILEILCTPWELPVSRETVNQFAKFIEQYFGSDWSSKFLAVCDIAKVKEVAAPMKASKTEPALEIKELELLKPKTSWWKR